MPHTPRYLFVVKAIYPTLEISATCWAADPICIGGGGRALKGKEKGPKIGEMKEPAKTEDDEEEVATFCLTPAVTGGVDILGLMNGGPMEASYLDLCLNDITIQGVPLVSELCISSLVGILAPEDGTAADSIGTPCDAIADGKTCTSCSLCPGGGMTFDCSEISPELISSTCSGSFPTEFSDVANPGAVDVPLLDGLRR